MVNFFLQGKGGCGKTTASVIFSQYLQYHQLPVQCIDTDPINSSFYAFKALNVDRISLLKNNRVNTIVFDDLMEKILENQDKHYIIDNGAFSFVPVTRYLIENEIPQTFKDEGIELNIHTIIAGGQSLSDTLNGMNSLIRDMQGSNIYVWLNHYFGEIEQNGIPFKKMKAYTENEGFISGFISLEQQSELFTQDMQKMLQHKLTFAEAHDSDLFRIMSKSRLKKSMRILYSELDQVFELNHE